PCPRPRGSAQGGARIAPDFGYLVPPGAAIGSINLRRSLSTKESTHPRGASVLIGMRRPRAAPTRSAAPTPNVARGFPPEPVWCERLLATKRPDLRLGKGLTSY